jgi:hypothetical protein
MAIWLNPYPTGGGWLRKMLFVPYDKPSNRAMGALYLVREIQTHVNAYSETEQKCLEKGLMTKKYWLDN